MNMDNEFLEDALAKIERTETQIEDLNNRVEAFFESKPYERVSKVNAKRSEEVWRFRLTQKPPRELAVITGEILHNIRSPLDNMLSAIALKTSGTAKGTAFPFGKNKHRFETHELPPKTKHLPPDAVDMIKALEPYKGGNNLLYAIHSANRADKHADPLKVANIQTSFANETLIIRSGELLVLGPRGGRHMVPAHRLPGGAGNDLTQPVHDRQPRVEIVNGGARSVYDVPTGVSLNENFEFLTVTPGTQFEADIEPSFAIVFRNVEGFEREPIVAVLNQMRQLTEGIVLTFRDRFL